MKVSDAGRRHAGDPGVPGVIAHYTSGSIQGPAPPAPPAPPPFTCQDSWNCSLAGECKDGVCVCDKPWTGSDCSQLSFKPAPISSCGKACAYHAMDEKNTSWGGSVIKGEDGKYYMATAEMANGCGLGSWTTNSQVAMAVASTPEGPYVKQQVVVPPWSHNPQIVRAIDGTFLIFTLGNGTSHGQMKHCSKSGHLAAAPEHYTSTEEEAAREVRGRGSSNKSVGFTIHYAKSLKGPWNAWNATIPNFRSEDNMDNWNPAPVVLPDGRIRIMVHTDPKPWAGEVIIEAEHWQGPYMRITDDVMGYCSKCQEDPFMWVDKRGHWHALVHKMFDPAGSSPIPSPGWAGGLIFSKDGLVWSEMKRCYSTNIKLENGEMLVTKRRERPKLIFDSNGIPTHLTNGAVMPDGQTYTIIQPLDIDNPVDTVYV